MAKSKTQTEIKHDKNLIKKMEKSMKEKRAAFIKKCNADVDLKGFEQKKKIALYALKVCKGSITDACKMINISRRTFYNFKDEDPLFEEAFQDIKLGVLDHVVNKLHERIDAGSDSSIQFYLDRRGKSEGWGNNLSIDHTTKGDSLNKALSNMTDEELEQKLKELNEKMK